MKTIQNTFTAHKSFAQCANYIRRWSADLGIDDYSQAWQLERLAEAHKTRVNRMEIELTTDTDRAGALAAKDYTDIQRAVGGFFETMPVPHNVLAHEPGKDYPASFSPVEIYVDEEYLLKIHSKQQAIASYNSMASELYAELMRIINPGMQRHMIQPIFGNAMILFPFPELLTGQAEYTTPAEF